MKFLRIFGLLVMFLGLAFGDAFAAGTGTTGNRYSFSLNDNGGSGGRVYSNNTSGLLDYGVRWGYDTIDGDGFQELTAIASTPTHSNPHLHFSGYNVNGIKVISSTGAFVTTNEALTSFNTNNTQLVAYWNANFYKLTLDEAGGSGTVVGSCTGGLLGCVLGEWYGNCYAVTNVLNTSELEVGMCVMRIQQTPTRTGYTFGGFYTGQNGTGTQIIDANGDIVETTYTFFSGPATIYAKWTPKVFTVTLNHQSPTNSPAPSTVYLKYATNWYSNQAATTQISSMTTVPTKTNYDFGGYWTGTNGSGIQVINSNGNFLTTQEVLTAITSNTTIYAKWTAAAPAVYTVTLNSNGGSGNHAIYYSNGNYYCDTSATQVINSNANVFTTCGFSAPTLTNNEFEGYYSNTSAGTQYITRDGKLTSSAQSLVLNTNTTWYAQYTCPANYYMNSTTNQCTACDTGFSAPAGSTEPEACIKTCLLECSKPTCPAAVSEHGHCEYGNESENGVMNQVDLECIGTTPTCSMTAVCDTGYDLNATHNECVARKYPVTYDCGTGTGPGTNDIAIYDVSYTVLGISDANCSYTGHSFTGWKLSVDNSPHPAGDQFIWNYTNENPTFTAQWGGAIAYNINYELNGGILDCSGSECPSTYTYGTGATITVVPTRLHSEFVGWCTDSGLSNCNLTQIIDTSATGDKTFYANWKCIEPYHQNLAGDACEACPDDYFYDQNSPTLCSKCPSQFPHSTRPFNWSENQCWRSCTNNAICQPAPSNIINTLGGTCVPGIFDNIINNTQIEFKGNSGNVVTCDADNVPYCPYGFECSSENVTMPRTVPVKFWSGTNWSSWALRYVVGLGRWNTNPGTMTSGDMWSAIMGPAQQMEFSEANDAYTFIIYPTNTAPNATVSGHTFVGYYDAQTGGTQHVGGGYALNATNAQSVGVTLDDEIPGNRNLYAHYDNSAYTITYVLNGGTWGPMSSCPGVAGCPSTYTYGTGATINSVPTRTFSEFVGWCIDAALTDCSLTQTIAPDATGNRVFYAKWDCVEPYHLSANGQSCEACGSGQYWAGVDYGCKSCATNTDNQFPFSKPPFNWGIDQCYRRCGPEITCDTLIPNGSDANDFIRIDSGSQQVSFYGNEHLHTPVMACGTTTEPAVKNCPYGFAEINNSSSPIAAFKPKASEVAFFDKTPARVGTRFTVGCDNAQCNGYSSFGLPNIWSEIVGEAQKNGAYTFIVYPSERAPNADMPGYSFNGYYDERDTGGTRYIEPDYVLNATNARSVLNVETHASGQRNLFAQYNANRYTVTYMCGEGATGDGITDNVTYGTDYTVWNQDATDCINQGHNFTGWLFTGDSAVHNGGDSVSWTYPNDEQTFTAQWSGANTYTITYKPNYSGATQSDVRQGVTYGVTFTTKPGNTFTRPGHIITKWGDNATTPSAYYPDLDTTYTYSTSSNKDLFALWHQCEDGTQPNSAGTACEPCPDGTAGTGGMCEPCSDGTQPNATGTACEPCPDGTAGTGGTCEPCPDGTQPNETGTACVPCPEGTAGTNGTCEPCTGVTVPNTNGTACEPCPDGTQPNATHTACVPCPAGTYGTGGTCEPCPNGYVSDEGATTCEPCPAGTYGYNNQCVPCEPGYISGAGATACIPCPANTYWIDGTTCKDCPEGYSSAPASTSIDQCVLSDCPTGEHIEHGECVGDTKSCDAPYATSATRTWNPILKAYGSCQIQECNEGYHIASNACVPDDGECVVANGRGTREWDNGAWNTCEVTQCDPGYTANNAGTACERCSNYLGYDGQPAVSSYMSECEIASCMYQGQKYALINGQCKPICEDDSDETGSKHWDGTKCVRTCNPGYKMW